MIEKKYKMREKHLKNNCWIMCSTAGYIGGGGGWRGGGGGVGGGAGGGGGAQEVGMWVSVCDVIVSRNVSAPPPHHP